MKTRTRTRQRSGIVLVNADMCITRYEWNVKDGKHLPICIHNELALWKVERENACPMYFFHSQFLAVYFSFALPLPITLFLALFSFLLHQFIIYIPIVYTTTFCWLDIFFTAQNYCINVSFVYQMCRA